MGRLFLYVPKYTKDDDGDEIKQQDCFTHAHTIAPFRGTTSPHLLITCLVYHGCTPIVNAFHKDFLKNLLCWIGGAFFMPERRRRRERKEV